MNGTKRLSACVDHDLTIPPPSVDVLRTNSHGENQDDDGDDNNDQSHLELWSFRLHRDFPLSSLDGVKFNLKDACSASKGSGGVRIQVKDSDNSSDHGASHEEVFQIVQGEAFENETFRVLVPAVASASNSNSNDDSDDESHSSDNDDDDSDVSSSRKNGKKDSNDKKKKQREYSLHPAPKPFTRHFNVVRAFSRKSETQLAPLKGPEPADPMRHAYAPIPQRKGLKRRWMPLGVSSLSKSSVSRIQPMNKTGETEKNLDRAHDNGNRKVPGTPTKEPVTAKETIINGSKQEAKRRIRPEDEGAMEHSTKRRKVDSGSNGEAVAFEKDGHDDASNDDDDHDDNSSSSKTSDKKKDSPMTKEERKAEKARRKAEKKAKKEKKKAKKEKKLRMQED